MEQLHGVTRMITSGRIGLGWAQVGHRVLLENWKENTAWIP
jgi:hypothetical protein